MMAPTTRPTPALTVTPVSRPLVRVGLLGFAVAVLFALPGAQSLWVENGSSQAFLHADVVTSDDPLHKPLNLTLDELANLSRPAANAIQDPGASINLTNEEELELQGLFARLDEGGHDGVQVNGTGYRFAIAMPGMVITGGPDGGDEGLPAPPTTEPSGNDTEDIETGEASGIAIGSLTLFSAGAMYWVRRLA